MRFPLLIIPFVAIIVLCGCEIIPGHVSVKKSEFDGSTQVVSQPAWIVKSKGITGIFLLKLHRNSKMPEGELVLTAGVAFVDSIADGDSLKFNIDGAVVGLKSFDSSTHFDPGDLYLKSSRRYPVTVDFVRRLVTASNVTTRLSLSKDYVEGTFSRDGANLARPSFNRFLNALDGKPSETPKPTSPGRR